MCLQKFANYTLISLSAIISEGVHSQSEDRQMHFVRAFSRQSTIRATFCRTFLTVLLNVITFFPVRSANHSPMASSTFSCGLVFFRLVTCSYRPVLPSLERSLCSNGESLLCFIDEKAKMMWVQRNGSMCSGRCLPIDDLQWNGDRERQH